MSLRFKLLIALVLVVGLELAEKFYHFESMPKQSSTYWRRDYHATSSGVQYEIIA